MKKEFVKVMGIALVCIGLFCAAFIGINSRTLAAIQDEPESVALDPVTVAAPPAPLEEVVPPQDFQSPTVTTYVFVKPDQYPGTNNLSPEEVVEFAAMYIWEMLGVCVDGTHFNIWYTNCPSATRSTWSGSVKTRSVSDIAYVIDDEDEEAITITRMRLVEKDGETVLVEDPTLAYPYWEEPRQLFSFSIDAITGERISLLKITPELFTSENRRDLLHANQDLIPATIDNIEEYKNAALDFAKRHFNNTEIVSIEFDRAFPALLGKDDSGYVVVQTIRLDFLATDSTGREAEIMILSGTMDLHSINTHHNDMIPGFVFEGCPGPGEK